MLIWSVFAYILGLDDPTADIRSILNLIFPNSLAVQALFAPLFLLGQVPYTAFAEAFGNLLLICPTSRLTSVLHSSGYSVWRYRFSGVFPNTQTFPQAGAYHSAEIPEVFGNDAVAGAATSEQLALNQYMQKAWADFAKDPEIGPGWPAYGDDRVVQDLGGVASAERKLITSLDVDGGCLAGGYSYTDLVGL